MLIHFIASTSNLKEDVSKYRSIIEAVHAQGSVLARDWVEPELKRQKLKNENVNWQLAVDENIQALSRADAVIAEIGRSSFAVGYQVAVAVQQKKPVLLLAELGKKDKFSAGLMSELVQTETYSRENVSGIIESFIQNNNLNSKDLRFNFFIDRQIYNYLRWASYKTGKNKSEILRDLVVREIEKSDT